MDKETLSNYGWIVICVMVLAVMIALATPFGSFIADAVTSARDGLFETNQNSLNVALESAGIATPIEVSSVEDLKDALVSAQSGKDTKIVLSEDINTTGADIELASFNYSTTAQTVFNFTTGNITLDLNGKTITADTAGGSNVFSVFMVTGDANLTVIGEGTINYNTYGRSGGCAAFTVFGANSVINLNADVNVKCIGDGKVIQMIYAHGGASDLGKIYVTNGTYEHKDGGSMFYAQGGGSNSIIVSGGLFKTQLSETEFKKCATIVDGYTVNQVQTDADGSVWYEVVQEN